VTEAETVQDSEKLERTIEHCNDTLSYLTGKSVFSSESAKVLMLMIAAHESGGFVHTRQIGGGPAKSYWQIEPETHEDVLDYCQRKYPEVAKFMVYTCNGDYLTALETNPYYGALVTRMRLWIKPEPLPDVCDLASLSEYAKQHWNTYLGKAEPEDYLKAYLKWCK